jgi:hypothetical protein
MTNPPVNQTSDITNTGINWRLGTFRLWIIVSGLWPGRLASSDQPALAWRGRFDLDELARGNGRVGRPWRLRPIPSASRSGRDAGRQAGQTLGVGALREVKRLHQGRAEIPLYKLLVLDAATQEICLSRIPCCGWQACPRVRTRS